MEKYIDKTGFKLSSSIQSHLADAIIENGSELAIKRIKFTKWLIMKSKGDLSLRVNMDLLWKDFQSEEL